ncbi:MAG: glycoside hydrolase family 5 protein, partial [Clostridia bacterium]|nr:glycoside hydrolase family 5 protein [Clostridia bacterium]
MKYLNEVCDGTRKCLTVILCCALLLSLMIISAEADGILTPQNAISDMTWGVNLTTLYMADKVYEEGEGNSLGYVTNAPIGIGIWFWDGSFDWLSYNGLHDNTFTAEVAIPYCTDSTSYTWFDEMFQIGVFLTDVSALYAEIEITDAKIVLSNGGNIPVNALNGTYTADSFSEFNEYGLASSVLHPADIAGIPYASPNYNGGKLQITVNQITVPFSETGKVDYFFEYQRQKKDQYELTNVYLDQGVNVFRLPVTWTEFVQDSAPFTIDRAWLEAVQTEVDYILSKGAYCILNMHDDYMIRSFVEDHWEDAWMLDEYKEYVDARFRAIWEQIADFFKDYPPTLIFETANEPAMLWDLVSPNHPEISMSEHADLHNQRNNELNEILVDTVRSSGGNNDTRILCLSVGNYNSVDQLSYLEIPDDPYLIAQLHSYQEMELSGKYDPADYNFDYTGKTDAFFQKAAAFMEQTGIPLLIGEVGVSHKLSDEERNRRIEYYFQKCAENNMPALWWEDYFLTDDGYYYWIYDLENETWQTDNLETILNTYNLDIGDALAAPEISLGSNDVPHGENLNVGISIDSDAQGYGLYVISGDNRTAYWDYTETIDGGNRILNIPTDTMPLGEYKLTIYSYAEGRSPGYASAWFNVTVNGSLDAPVLRDIPGLVAQGQSLEASFDQVDDAQWYNIRLLYCGEYGYQEEQVYRNTVSQDQADANLLFLDSTYLQSTGKYRIQVSACAEYRENGTGEAAFWVVKNTEQGITLLIENDDQDISDWPARKDFTVKIIAPGATAIRFLDINGNWNYQDSRNLNSQGLYQTTQTPDSGTYIIAAQAAYDDGYNWDTIDTWNFDWTMLNWSKTSNEVRVSVSALGTADAASFSLPNGITRGELLHVIINSAGDEASACSGNRFLVYPVNEFGDINGDTIDTGVIDTFPVTVSLPTGDREGNTMWIRVVSLREGYNSSTSEPQAIPLNQGTDGQAIIFNVQENILSGVNFSASVWAPDAAFITLWVRNNTADETEFQSWGDYSGSYINNPWLWIGDAGEYEFYVVAHYADSNGNETGRAESEHLIRTAIYSKTIQMPFVAVPSVVPGNQRLAFRVDGLDQDAVDYWNIRVHDCDGWDEIAFFCIDDYTSLPASFILPANQISADRYYNIEVWVDGPKAEGKNYNITIHASDGSDILSLPANLITIESEAFSGTGAHT